MIAKGVPHAHGARLARYLVTGKDRERAELFELRGFAASGIVEAFRSVHVMANGSRCVFPFFHVSVRNRDGETLNRHQWTYAADAIEQALGLVDQPRAIAFHACEETGENHMHVAWSRMDQDSLTARPLPFSRERLKRVSRELERHFGLTAVSSARTGPIAYAPTRREEEQSRRLGTDLRYHRETIRDCFDRSDCGRSFQRALADQGLILARGGRRDFLAIDRAGGTHALGKRILGAPAAEIRTRFSDLSRDQLPTVEEARHSLRSLQAPKITINAEPVPPRPVGPSNDEEGALSANTSKEIPVQPVEDAAHDFVYPTAPSEEIELPISRPFDAPAGGANTGKGREKSGGFTAALKRQFRAAIRALIKRAPSPQPQARRRRTGETVGTFRLAARSLLGPIISLPAVSRAVGFLHDTLLWLHLSEWNEIADHDAAGGTVTRDDNHHSPHP